jgi:hypothetical protein
MRIPRFILILACMLLPQPGWGRVLIRWTEPAIPSSHALGISDVVIDWRPQQQTLIEAAKNKGFHVYAEVAAEEAHDEVARIAREGLTGIVVKASGSSPAPQNHQRLIQEIRSAYPKLGILLLEPGGKQPQMRGTMVVNRNGILEVSSPTRQPWIDSNVALIRFERVYDPSETPLIGFDWNLTDDLERRLGPPPADYMLAVAEAGAFGADLILNLHPKLQQGLAQGENESWGTWQRIRRYIDFYSHRRGQHLKPLANIGVITDDYDVSYEAVNLLARHNIPFRFITPQEFASSPVESLALIVAWSPLNESSARKMADFASSAGTAVLVGEQGAFPWRSRPPIQKNENAAIYSEGAGRIVELSEPIVDPEAFAQDVRRLLKPQQVEMSLWNALTVLANPYQKSGTEDVLELVNYSEEPLRVQVRLKGIFSTIRYETPERGCCQPIPATQDHNFTEFIVPQLRIGGRVHLGRE